MRVLSLFDGMACGYIAMLETGMQIDEYVAFEIDKYAVQTSSHNFPNIKHRGDVFAADFTEFNGFDYLIGGSPCTYWSISQNPQKRETTASGIGWELFSQYVRALREAKPKYFIYENNKSMSAAIRQSITDTFGFEPICINSALVSAQSRKRLYWVGKRNDDGTYSKVDIKQPNDKGILLNDVLDANTIAWQDKAYTYTTRCQGACIENTLERHQHTMVAMPIVTTKDGKSFPVAATEYKGSSIGHTIERRTKTLIAEPTRCNSENIVYEVKNNLIAVKNRLYPVSLADGFYTVRKLSIDESKRLQTVPDWYEFPVSNIQAYKMLGNGWTVDVIAHILRGIRECT